ncbi:proline--tRNA ligase [Haloferax mediterranei ATCC 33500]|uniref:proline--tRNA ligase n=1 Tax=Haloferax mediterranei (strain ATCC 33500 / DSM 1411 / JCM 8866 / NBRC 14739 / NCIMB 2177 / R-4) TaxID=523841 RepID=I3R791_HALMT|nr:prolyl-tRNA synthetase [Haloferax mediterranei ATCC 33500]AHZ23475.1 tRNA synthetase [Haloferax mediterranei ATCC 33500]ELZ99647.1 prolyl-tRNA ligase [Haloferax mediterranei ATCC 33500]QCQ76672.1 proline--tRNA ligase [Haloferax mediterranei ATCC 33500]
MLFTSREAAGWENDTVQLAVRAGFIRQFGSGLFGFTPTGERVRRKIIRRIKTEMDTIGGQAVSLPNLQYKPIWEQSGRWGSFEGEMFTFENRDGQQLCLAPSHEEGIVHLVEGIVRSYEDVPLLLYQVERKHRDDHPRNGLLRTKEFTMKDAYSLHATADSLDEWYGRVRDAYCRIFDALGIDFVVADAQNSVMGGSASEEFIAPVETGSVELVYCEAQGCRVGVTDESPDASLFEGDVCPDCGAALTSGEGIEIGHVFKLGTRYTDPADLTVDMADGSERPVLMGSYGIGVDRLVHTLIEQHGDETGCRWPVTDRGTAAPYTVSIIPLEYGGDIQAVADRLHRECGRATALLFDDLDQTIGERFAESDLLGVPWKVILGNHFRETGEVELEHRDGKTRFIAPGAVSELVGQASSGSE